MGISSLDSGIVGRAFGHAPRTREAPQVPRNTQQISLKILESPRRSTRYERLLKPAIDRALGMVLLIILAPVMVAVAVSVWISLGRPILFRQTRVGRGEKLFALHKFRTMRSDRRHQHTAYVGTDRRVTHKHRDDPRLPRLGRTLRKWTLDELPQLSDVVTGRLS